MPRVLLPSRGYLELLEPEQIKQYERNGFLFPLPTLSSDECLKFRSAFEELETYLGGKATRLNLVQTHLHFGWAYDLAVHSTILDAIEDLIGPNILIHSSSVFCKYPGDHKYVSWHQDGYYLQLNPPQLVSAWIALSDSTIENGCMQVLSGTHQQNLTHTEVKHKDNLLITGMKVAVEVDKAKAVDIILKLCLFVRIQVWKRGMSEGIAKSQEWAEIASRKKAIAERA